MTEIIENSNDPMLKIILFQCLPTRIAISLGIGSVEFYRVAKALNLRVRDLTRDI